MGFEVDRTVSNLIELEHPKIAGETLLKAYELLGMIEVDRS